MTNGVGILFNRKSGKAVKVLTGSVGMLKLFAMNNVSATRDYVVFDSDGICKGYFEGKKNDIPTICNDMVGKPYTDFNITNEQIKELFN